MSKNHLFILNSEITQGDSLFLVFGINGSTEVTENGVAEEHFQAPHLLAKSRCRVSIPKLKRRVKKITSVHRNVR